MVKPKSGCPSGSMEIDTKFCFRDPKGTPQAHKNCPSNYKALKDDDKEFCARQRATSETACKENEWQDEKDKDWCVTLANTVATDAGMCE